MKNLDYLKSKIAPLSKKDFEAKLSYNKKEALSLVSMVTCQGKTVSLSRNKKRSSFVKLYDWNPRTQRIKLSINFQTNEIPRTVAQSIINDYLNMDYEYDWSWN